MTGDTNYNTPERLERYRQTIEDNAEISRENKKLILEFYDLCKAQGLSNARLAKTLWQMRTLGELMGKKGFAKATQKDIVELVNGIQKKYSASNTIDDYKIMLKKFYRFTFGKGRIVPEEVVWIKTSNAKRKVNPADMLNEQDILKIIQGQNIQNDTWARVRNKALVSFLFDSGVRAGELLGIRIGDIKPNGNLWHVTVTGKTGQRTIPIYTSIPYLKDYLAIHPRNSDANSFLWCSYNNLDKSMSRARLAQTLAKALRIANINKPANPHNFRHSATTRDSTFMSDQKLKKKNGWTASSRQLSTYSHIGLEDLENSYKEKYKIDGTDTEDSALLLKLCAYCNAENKPHDKFCINCKKPLDIKEALRIQEKNEALEALTIELLKAIAQTNPEIKEKFKELMARRRIEDIL